MPNIDCIWVCVNNNDDELNVKHYENPFEKEEKIRLIYFDFYTAVSNSYLFIWYKLRIILLLHLTGQKKKKKNSTYLMNVLLRLLHTTDRFVRAHWAYKPTRSQDPYQIPWDIRHFLTNNHYWYCMVFFFFCRWTIFPLEILLKTRKFGRGSHLYYIVTF